MNQLFRRPSVTKASPARCFPLSDVYIALFSRNNAPADAVTLTLSGASGPPLLPFGLEVAALQLCLLILISFQAALRLRVRALLQAVLYSVIHGQHFCLIALAFGKLPVRLPSAFAPVHPHRRAYAHASRYPFDGNLHPVARVLRSLSRILLPPFPKKH